MEGGSPLFDASTNEFLRLISTIERKGRRLRRDESTGCVVFEECTFIPYDKVKVYFQDKDKIDSLLRSVYSYPDLAPDAGTVRVTALKLLCILVLINRGGLFQHLFSNGIRDADIPFREQPSDLKYLDARDPTFWAEFDQQQWRFFPHKFDLVHIDHRVMQKSMIFPIYECKPIDIGDGRTVYQIKVHGDYHSLRTVVGKLSIEQEEKRNTFVLKSLDGKDSTNTERYSSEVKAFRQLGCNDMPDDTREPPAEIIRCFGSFRHNDIYHILLEFADRGTLLEYLQGTPKPTNLEDLSDIWERFKAIASGVARIHMVLADGGSHIGVFQGYHQDLKWTNILVFTDTNYIDSTYKVIFKIADLGLTNFVENPHYLGTASGQGRVGTRTFGSPENHQKHEFGSGTFTSGSADDIWSLACIFSIISTWTVGGWQLVDNWTNWRITARKTLEKTPSDCFHDDNRVLPAVQEWHTFLASSKMGRDHITSALWEVVLEPAFAPATQRSSALRFATGITEVIKPSKIRKALTFSNDTSAIEQVYEPRRTPQRGQTVAYSQRDASSRHERLPMNSPLVLEEADNDYPASPSDGEPGSSISPVLNPASSEAWNSNSQQQQFSSVAPISRSHVSNDGGGSNPRYSMDNDHRRSVPPDRYADSSQERSRMSMSGNEDVRSSRDSYFQNMSSVAQGKQPAHAKLHSSNCPANPNNRPPMDHMSILQLLEWKKARDRRSWRERRETFDTQIPHSNLKQNLKERDHVFLFEDSATMKKHWPKVLELFAATAKFIKETDDDGLEVYFTVSTEFKKDKDSTPLVDLVKSVGKKLDSSSQPVTTLRKIWNKHRDEIRHGKASKFWSERKDVALTIYIFTDGVWQQKTDVNMIEFLREVVEFMQQHSLKKGRVGIQLVQFGNGQQETEMLEKLDSKLKGILQLDIVDHEQVWDGKEWKGNVWKILLGSVLPGFDDDDEIPCTCS